MVGTQAVIVIGSGPAGAMAAHELVRQGIHVIMLESGGNFPGGALVRVMGRNVFRRQNDQGLENGTHHVATGDPQTEWWVNLSPGGLSNQWTGAVPRFAPEDFYEGERLHERYRWPLDYQDLIPFYEQAEQILQVTSDPRNVPNLPACKPAYSRQLPQDWQQIASHAACRGQGLTVLPLAGGPPNLVVGRSTAFNSYTNIVHPLLRSPHFELLTGAHALRLEYSAAKGQVDAVVYHDQATNSEHRLEAAAIVVACGALHSTKLLFDSACATFPQGLGNTEGVLGSYLHDHPRDWWTFELQKPLTRPAPPAYLTRMPYAESDPLLAASSTIGLTPSAQEKLLSFTPLRGNNFAVQVLGTMVPTEQHYVKPDALKKDAFGLPLLDICIQYDTATVQNVIAARERLLSIMEEAGYRGKLCEAPTEIVPGSSVHYGGTIRMHKSPQHGMLDGWNRLHAVPNVQVVDASCFTTGAEKNPTPTVMALAARAADRLVHDLKTGDPGEG